METIRIYHSIWKKEMFIGSLCVVAALMIGIYDIRKLSFALFLGLTGLFLLLSVFDERLLHRPYLTITDERIIINRKWHKETIIRFDEIKSFEREKLTIWKLTIYSGVIIIHLVNGHGSVNMINANGLVVKQQALCDLLNERLG